MRTCVIDAAFVVRTAAGRAAILKPVARQQSDPSNRVARIATRRVERNQGDRARSKPLEVFSHVSLTVKENGCCGVREREAMRGPLSKQKSWVFSTGKNFLQRLINIRPVSKMNMNLFEFDRFIIN